MLQVSYVYPENWGILQELSLAGKDTPFYMPSFNVLLDRFAYHSRDVTLDTIREAVVLAMDRYSEIQTENNIEPLRKQRWIDLLDDIIWPLVGYDQEAQDELIGSIGALNHPVWADIILSGDEILDSHGCDIFTGKFHRFPMPDWDYLDSLEDTVEEEDDEDEIEEEIHIYITNVVFFDEVYTEEEDDEEYDEEDDEQPKTEKIRRRRRPTQRTKRRR